MAILNQCLDEIKGRNEVVCPPIVFYDDEEVISSYETETDRSGQFVISIEILA